MKLRPGHRNRFLASCWVMVEPPRDVGDVLGVVDRRAHFDQIDAPVGAEAGVLGGDHRARQDGRDPLQRDHGPLHPFTENPATQHECRHRVHHAVERRDQIGQTGSGPPLPQSASGPDEMRFSGGKRRLSLRPELSTIHPMSRTAAKSDTAPEASFAARLNAAASRDRAPARPASGQEPRRGRDRPPAADRRGHALFEPRRRQAAAAVPDGRDRGAVRRARASTR